MTFASLIPALTLALCAVILIAFLVWVMLRTIVVDLTLWLGRQKLSRKQQLLTKADELAQRGLHTDALPVLRSAFIFDHALLNPVLIEGVTHHHLSILSRLIAISEKTSSHIPNLAVVEDLLASRAQISRALHEAHAAKRTLRDRRAEQKELPEWALAEYKKKLSDLRDKLDTNRKSLEVKLSEIFAALSTTPSEQEVTYH